jgi:16S rRNA (uracil1498-N3)-methyltransferase
MARELRRLLIAPERLAAAGVSLVLEPAEAHYLGRVLRTRSGERVALVDGCGGLWTARLVEPSRLELEQPAASPLQRQPPASPRLQLALAVPRREPELVWRMATELGVDQLQPLQAERCVVAGRWPVARWRTIVTEAVEQCERLWAPELREPVAAQAFLGGPGWAAAPPADGTWPGGISAGAIDDPVDATTKPCLGLLATTRRSGLPLLAALLREFPHPGAPDLCVAIGPEGGWSPAEEATALAAGWQPVSLGPSILRTSTAALAGLADLVSWRNLSSPSFPAPSP